MEWGKIPILKIDFAVESAGEILSAVFARRTAKKNGDSGRTRIYNPPVNSRMLKYGVVVLSMI